MLNTVLEVIGFILFFLLMCTAMDFIHKVSGYFVEKRNNEQFQNNKEADLLNKETLEALSKRIEVSNEFLNFIDERIDSEITNILVRKARLNELYQALDLDEDIKTISTKVFKSIKEEIFVDPALILTDDYCMDYISRQTTMKLIASTYTYNDKVNNPTPVRRGDSDVVS